MLWKACALTLRKNTAKDYLPDSANYYGSKSGAQEAHEAIRPTDVKLMKSALKGMDESSQKIYELIWRQFVACQMTPAKI